MSLVYKMNQENGDKKSDLMTQVGLNWNQLVYELQGWHQFGQDAEEAQKTKQKPTAVLV